MTGSKTGRRSFGTNSIPRIWFGGILGVAVALLIVLAPTASASPSAKTLRSPYAGSGTGYESGYFVGCGGAAAFARSPFFNVTSGRAYAIVQSNSSSCGKSDSDSDAYAEVEYASNGFALPAGHGSIRERWSVSFSINLVANPGKRGYADASVAILLYSDLYDSTNRTYAGEGYTGAYFNATSNGTLSASFSGMALVNYVNGTFVSGHSYMLYVEFELEAYTEVSSKIASAGAAINAGSSGNLAKLTSIALP